MSLLEKLDKIRSSPKLQNQEYTATVLKAIDETLASEDTKQSATAYFATILALLAKSSDSVNTNGDAKDILQALIYLLDLVATETPPPLLRSKTSQVLGHISVALSRTSPDAPLLKSVIGVLEALLSVQDQTSWKIPATQQSPRQGLSHLLVLVSDTRPKVRKRAIDALTHILARPPSPSLVHPALDTCAESALQKLQSTTRDVNVRKADKEAEPALIHALQLTGSILSAAKAWPVSTVEPLCQTLMPISKSTNQHIVMACFETFEALFTAMIDNPVIENWSMMLDNIAQLQPSKEDTHLLPTWVAILTRAHEVLSQSNPDHTFQRLPDVFAQIASFLDSTSTNIRTSASEGLVALIKTCIPQRVLVEPAEADIAILQRLGAIMDNLLSVNFQSAWMEVFNVVNAMITSLRWRAVPSMDRSITTIGDLRGNDAFNGNREADLVLSSAITSLGPDVLLNLLPLNITKQRPGQPGRAWMLPLMRNTISNTKLRHFTSHMMPLSDTIKQRIAAQQKAEKTVEIKIFETLDQQIWATLPGYCTLPTDLTTAFDQAFAETLAGMLYREVRLRTVICRALRSLVESNQQVLKTADHELVRLGRITVADAKSNLSHLAGFASQVLAVLFNVYSQTLPQDRIAIIEAIDAYLGILPSTNLAETFDRVVTMLYTALGDAQPQEQKEKAEKGKKADKMPSTSHTLMDLVVTIAVHLPRESYPSLFKVASLTINRKDDPQLQKKAYKLFTRLAETETGQAALAAQTEELQKIIHEAASTVSVPARRDRLNAISLLIPTLPAADLHFIPSILSEAVISVKESNEKARIAAFDLLVLLGQRMSLGGQVINAKVSHMPEDAPTVTANLEEFFTMVSAGLAGSTPHMISASITALARLLFEFRTSLSEAAISDLVQTIDLFLTSANREIVRSCLGFVKVCILSLPSEMMLPRLPTLIPNLCVWSHEHKAQFKAKVKHIFERMIRRFGVEIVQKHTPAQDSKLITNIRKAKDRAKKKRTVTADEETGQTENAKPKGQFESDNDNALYQSDESDGSGSDNEDLGLKKSAKRTKDTKVRSKQYIVEDDDTPMDLLDKRSLAHVSSSKPQQPRTRKPKDADVDMDGKLVFTDEKTSKHSKDAMDVDEMDIDGGTLEQGINAYVDAIRGGDAARVGQGGRLKFSTGRKQADAEDEMDVDDEDDVVDTRKPASRGGRGGPNGRGGRGGNGSGRGGQQQGRRGLGVEKQRHERDRGSDRGRISKTSRGRGGQRGRASRGRR